MTTDMTLDDLFRLVLEHFPMANIQEDLDGEVIIYTGLMYDAPMGYQGFGPQNIPAKYRPDMELREIRSEDIA